MKENTGTAIDYEDGVVSLEETGYPWIVTWGTGEYTAFHLLARGNNVHLLELAVADTGDPLGSTEWVVPCLL